MPLKPKYPLEKVLAYRQDGHREVEGWLSEFDMDLIAVLAAIQSQHNVSGAVGEIGVGLGKLFILLNLLRHDGEKAFCIDVFDRQELNVDNSWYSSESSFCANVSKHVGDLEDVSFLRGSSDGFSPGDIALKVGQVRLFSIDGGHTKYLTMNDLNLADRSLTDLGVVILDDVFHYQWPGVSDGLFSYFSEDNINIKPFAISGNKLFLCRPRDVDVISTELKEKNTEFFLKESEFLGCRVDIYSRPSEPGTILDSFARSEHWLRLRTTPLGRLIKAIHRSLMR